MSKHDSWLLEYSYQTGKSENKKMKWCYWLIGGIIFIITGIAGLIGCIKDVGSWCLIVIGIVSCFSANEELKKKRNRKDGK